jgi:glucose-1-phosphate adenylyltransferase
MDLCAVEPQFNLYDQSWPTYTLWHNDPPAKTVFDEDTGRRAQVVDSLLCPGVVVSGAQIRRSILSNLVFVDELSKVEESLLFRGTRVGKRVKIRKAIIDKWVNVPDGCEIGYDLESDREKYTVTDSGIVVVPRGYEFT